MFLVSLMIKYPLDDADFQLIEAANAEFSKLAPKDWHGVAAALRLEGGEIVTSRVLEAENPALTICAEPIAIGKALEAIAVRPVFTIVAVRQREESDHKVIPPCGRCREFITDYAPQANVIVFDETEGRLIKVPALDLLPFKYRSMP